MYGNTSSPTIIILAVAIFLIGAAGGWILKMNMDAEERGWIVGAPIAPVEEVTDQDQ